MESEIFCKKGREREDSKAGEKGKKKNGEFFVFSLTFFSLLSLSPPSTFSSFKTMNALALRSPLAVAPRRSSVAARAGEGAQINKTVDKASPKVI